MNRPPTSLQITYLPAESASSCSVHVAQIPKECERWLKALWYSEGPLPSAHERVLPSATADIVVNLGAPMRLVEGVGNETILGATIGGQLLRPITLAHPTIHRALGMRLHPLALRAILGISPALVLNATVTPAELGICLRELEDECDSAVSGTIALRRAFAWLGRRLLVNSAEPAPLFVRWVCHEIDRAHGNCRIGELQDRTGYGTTQFIRRFQAELGMTPKEYARHSRVAHLLDKLDPARSLADTALEVGFYDQAHMNRECKAITGETPTTILRDRYTSGLTLQT